MKKTISVVTACTVLFSTSFIYANENDTTELDNKLTQNRQEQTTLEGKIKNLDTKIVEIEKNISETNNKIVALDAEITKAKDEIKALEENIKKNEDALGKRLKAINGNYSIGYMKVIFSSSSISDFFNNVYVVKQVVEQDKDILKELDSNKLSIEEKEKDLNSKKSEQEVLKSSLVRDNETIQSDKNELESLKSALEAEENSLENELEEIAAEAARQAAMNSSDELSGAVISNGFWPVPGHSTISSPYGYRLHPVLNVQKMHTGIDIPAPTGTPAVATDNGTVIFSGTKGSYGNTVMIQHDDGKVSLYAHNSQLLVSVGQRVQKGQAVTKIGSTGRSTGPHLHFEIRINGKHTNPVPYI